MAALRLEDLVSAQVKLAQADAAAKPPKSQPLADPATVTAEPTLIELMALWVMLTLLILLRIAVAIFTLIQRGVQEVRNARKRR